jgi:hypothetical protein
MSNANSVKKVSEVRAASHADVLASVHKLAGFGITKGTCTTAKALPRLQKRHPKTPRRQGCCTRKSSQATTNNDDSIHA